MSHGTQTQDYLQGSARGLPPHMVRVYPKRQTNVGHFYASPRTETSSLMVSGRNLATAHGIPMQPASRLADMDIIQYLKANFAMPLSANDHVKSVFVERDSEGWELHVFVDSLKPDITRHVLQQAGLVTRGLNARSRVLIDVHVWPHEQSGDRMPNLRKLFAR